MTEFERITKMYEFEENAFRQGFTCFAGLDEAGRGPLAGPVVAAACILSRGTIIEGLNDSKKISEKNRERLYFEIIDKSVSYGIGFSKHTEIDEVNILNATKLAMKRAISQLNPQPDYLLLDAIELKDIDLPQIPIIKGDSLSFSIAAASILAKVTRDRLMKDISEKYPEYRFEKHKGYGTKEHYEAIKAHGLCEIHRKTFTKGYW
ncbi:MAG: ribonuclease HII [Bacillota bacterium]